MWSYINFRKCPPLEKLVWVLKKGKKGFGDGLRGQIKAFEMHEPGNTSSNLFSFNVVSNFFHLVWFFWGKKRTNWNSMYGREHDGMLIHENFHPGLESRNCEAHTRVFSIYFYKRNNFPTNQQNQKNWKKISRLTKDYKYNYFLIVSLFTNSIEIYFVCFVSRFSTFTVKRLQYFPLFSIKWKIFQTISVAGRVSKNTPLRHHRHDIFKCLRHTLEEKKICNERKSMRYVLENRRKIFLDMSSRLRNEYLGMISLREGKAKSSSSSSCVWFSQNRADIAQNLNITNCELAFRVNKIEDKVSWYQITFQAIGERRMKEDARSLAHWRQRKAKQSIFSLLSTFFYTFWSCSFRNDKFCRN